MRMAELMPFGLTSLLLMARAMVSASFVKMSFGGYVDAVLTFCIHFFVFGVSIPLPERVRFQVKTRVSFSLT